MFKMQMERERHAQDLDDIRAELQEWEAKRQELAAMERDPENQEKIDHIIALLKDQMAHQEDALVNLPEVIQIKLTGDRRFAQLI